MVRIAVGSRLDNYFLWCLMVLKMVSYRLIGFLKLIGAL